MRSEVIVHAEAQITGLQPIVRAGECVEAAAEIHVEVLDLGRPIRRKTDFHAETGSPAKMSLAFIKAAQFGCETTVGKTGGPIEQDIVHRVTETAAQGAKPRVGKFPGSESIVGSA